MSAFSTVGGLFIGGVAAIAGIVTVETRPEPTSAIVICEDYVPAEASGSGAVGAGGSGIQWVGSKSGPYMSERSPPQYQPFSQTLYDQMARSGR